VPDRKTARQTLEAAGALTYEETVREDGSKVILARFQIHGLSVGAFHTLTPIELDLAKYDAEGEAKEALARKLLDGVRDCVIKLSKFLDRAGFHHAY
jgi:hypothetical protein